MKKISKRAWMALALAFALLAGLLVFFGEYFIEAKTWVAFPGSPHVYTGVNPDCGKIYDRSGMLLLNTNDGRVYNADEAVRRALRNFHPPGRVILVAAGKAAWQMAAAACALSFVDISAFNTAVSILFFAVLLKIAAYFYYKNK